MRVKALKWDLKQKKNKLKVSIMKLKIFIANSRVFYPKLIDVSIQHKYVYHSVDIKNE